MPKAPTVPISTIYHQRAYIKALYTEKTVFDLVKPFLRKWHLFMVKNDEFKWKISFLHNGLIFRQMVLQALEKGSKQEAKEILDLQSWQSQGNRGFRPTPGPKNVIRRTCDRPGLKADPAR